MPGVAEDLDGGFGEAQCHRQVVEVEVEPFDFAEALRCRVRQARQGFEIESASVFAEAFGCRVLNRRELKNIHGIFIFQKLLRNLFGQHFLVAYRFAPPRTVPFVMLESSYRLT